MAREGPITALGGLQSAAVCTSPSQRGASALAWRLRSVHDKTHPYILWSRNSLSPLSQCPLLTHETMIRSLWEFLRKGHQARSVFQLN